jgi:hypothetical protein
MRKSTMRDGTHENTVISAIDPAVYAADGTPITIDRLGYDSLTFVLAVGIGGITFTGTNKIEFVMQHSDDATAWDPVGADNVLNAVPSNTGVVNSLTTAHAAATVTRIGYVDGTVGDRRYVRLWPDFSGTHGTGTPIAAVAILGEPRISPVA